MGQITLKLKDETMASLRKDFDAFLRVSLKLDPQFATPSFEDFLRAKLLDNMVPLTEHAVQRMLQGGQYAWAKRTLDKEFPDVVAILMQQATEFGFGFAARGFAGLTAPATNVRSMTSRSRRKAFAGCIEG